jgi:hypothetical protein
MITYLKPAIFRRGAPVIIAVDKYRSVVHKNKWAHFLIVYSKLRRPDISKSVPYEGVEDEYGMESKSKIDKCLYDAFVARSKFEHKRYQASRNEAEAIYKKLNETS